MTDWETYQNLIHCIYYL